MATNLDAQRRAVADDRDFIICGQTFTIRKRVPPEVLASLASMRSLDAATADFDDLIAKTDQIVLQLLVRRDRERWATLRAEGAEDGDDALEFNDIQAVMGWAMETLSDRPLGSAESSQPSSPTPDTPSQPTPSPLAAVPSTG